jgi:hypothetical protein
VGWVSALDREGRTIWIVDAHGYGKRFIVRAEESEPKAVLEELKRREAATEARKPFLLVMLRKGRRQVGHF